MDFSKTSVPLTLFNTTFFSNTNLQVGAIWPHQCIWFLLSLKIDFYSYLFLWTKWSLGIFGKSQEVWRLNFEHKWVKYVNIYFLHSGRHETNNPPSPIQICLITELHFDKKSPCSIFLKPRPEMQGTQLWWKALLHSWATLWWRRRWLWWERGWEWAWWWQGVQGQPGVWQQ